MLCKTILKAKHLETGDIFVKDKLNVWTECSLLLKQVFGTVVQVNSQPLMMVKNHGVGVQRTGQRYLLIEVLAPNGQLTYTTLSEIDEVRLCYLNES